MKSKAKNLLVKLTSLVLAVFLVLPSQVWAADLLKKDSRKYTANSSIMGLATQTSPDDSKESLAEEADRQTLLKAKQATDQMDAYTIEKSATLSKTTKEIKYQYIIKSKAPSIESEKKENIYAIFALNNNTDLTDIKVDKVTTLDESGKEIKATYQASNPGIFANDTNISTLGIRSEKQANDLLYYLSAKVDDEAIAKIEKGDYSPIFALDMVLANNDKKAIYENRYALEVNKYTEEAKSDERLLEIKEEEKLEEVEESKSLIKGEYNPESNGLFDKNPATITWTDYILSTDDKEFAYDIDLDKAQETENSEISVEFYEAKENGFILNNSFSQKLPFANSIKLQIPKGQLARITLTTTINKEANAKEFTYNGKLLANPDHKVDASTEDSTTEEKANDDPDPLPEQKEESKEKSKDKEKAESDKTEITLEADPETNEVIVDPDLIKEEKADKNEEDQDYSAIDLNRDSVIRKFQEEENADPIMEIAINNIASLFNDYNKEAISYEDFLASLKEQSKDIDKEDFRAIATGLLAGINKDNYKVANIEIDTLLDDIYGKETITEIKEDEKAVEDSSIENNTDDDIPTQTIDQNLDLDSLDTENEADSLSPEEKDKQKALESFDKALDQVKEESKKPQDDDRTLFGNISEGVKGIFGQSNLKKADKELKAALAEGKSLEEIQALLLTLGEKYELNRKDEARLMADNEDAIKEIIARDADQNFRPSMLMAKNQANPLLAEQIDKNGNPAGSIIELGRDDVVQIIDPGDSNYEVNTDAYANPVIENGELKGYNWTIKVSSDTDLNELGLNVNLTEVVGSGLKEIEKSNVTLENNPIKGAFGIHDSKHHAPKAGIKDITYNFYTGVQGMQEKYIMDISIILTKKGKVGAKRFVMNGWPADKVKEATPIRAGMNNRTTILGEFTSKSAAKWTVTDAVSTGDDKGTKENPADTRLPWETRSLSNNQTLQQNGGKVAVYKIGSDGKMVQDGETQTVSEIPGKGTNPNANQAVGTIAVYEYNTSINDDKEPQTLSGVAISKYEDINIDQHWNLPQGYEKMPEQDIKVVDKSGNELVKTTVNEEDGKQRLITVPNVKVWDIQGERKFTKTQPKIVQTFPTKKVTIGSKQYKYNENTSYYNYNDKNHFILNSLMEIDNKNPATFKIVKVDSKTGEKLKGASFHLLGTGVSAVTDANGEATFTNIPPGTYTFQETKAPKGYKLDGEEKKITISDDGNVNVSGKNIDFSQPAGKTEVVEHNNYPNWPDYMNAMHYGKVDDSGNVEFYLYLKPIAPRLGGQTDRNTRLNISLPGVNITDVTAYNVSPRNRQSVKSAMEDQTVNNLQLGSNVINVNHNYKITGTPSKEDDYTGRTGYQIYFPKDRFAGDWGFLVKVKANIGDKNTANLYYDWLTNEDTANQANLQKVVPLSKNTSGADDKPTLTIKNTPFEKKAIEVVKFANTFTNGKRDRLSGAEFVLKDSEGNLITNKITDGNGKASFGEYPEGKYFVYEAKAPDGYEKNGVYFEVEVNESQEVSYTARFENSSATPVPGQDYFIEKGKEIGGASKNIVTSVNQWLDYNEGQAYSRGERPKVWEAYRYESLKYHADITLSSSSPGERFEIQFDRNLDFTQYFREFPKLKIKGKEVADPYFNYETNLLTYVFNENTKGGPATATIDLIGMIPSKYYAKNTGTYPFTIIVQPNQTGIPGQKHDKNIEAFFDAHDSGNNEPMQNYYFREIYEENGEYYVDVISYYNVIGDRNPYIKVKPKTLNYNWITTSFQGGNIADWVGEGTEPRQVLDRVKIYRTEANARTVNDNLVNDYMPLSMGFRAEQEPNIYKPVFDASVDPNQNATISQNGITLIYDKGQINPNGKLIDNKNQPLKIKMPSINNGEGYVIEQRFKIPDIKAFNNKWRAFVMNNGNLKSAFASGANKSFAKGDQTGGEAPKYYKEDVGIINNKYTPGQFKIIKSNEADNSNLAGATFELTDANNNTIYRTSGNDGEINFTNLAPGSYTLKETRAPKDFVKSEKRWSVTVYSDGSVRITQIGLAGSDESYFGNNENIIIMPVSNKPSGTEFRVYKKDSDGKPLQGAKFKITKQGDATFEKTATSDKNGVVEFEKLTQGTYIIEESEAPAGYNKLDKKWVLVIDKDGNKKVYNYRESSSTTTTLNSILEKEGVNWVDVAGRSVDGWESYDNRYTGWTGNNVEPFKMGTRIVGINRNDKYVIQRYVINPEEKNIDATTSATIHREKPEYQNMEWYSGAVNSGEEIQVFKLNKPVTGVISDIRLAEYGATDITSDVKKGVENSRFGQPQRLKLTLPPTDKPLVIDVKVPYKEDTGGVGTGMYWRESGVTYWKSDYYESASIIKEASPVVSTDGNIIGSYISEGSLDVTNDFTTYDFKLKKVKDNDNTKAIEGAKFRLTGPGEGGEEREITTGKDGIISFDKLRPGIYKLEEIEPAPGYEKSNVDWTVRITSDGDKYIKVNKQIGPTANTNLVEPNANGTNNSTLVRKLAYSSLLENKKESLARANSFGLESINVFSTGERLNLAKNTLEFSEESIPAALQGANNWQKVDPNASTGRRSFIQSTDLASTKITEINKADKKFRQVFLLKDDSSNTKREVQFHREPEEYGINLSDRGKTTYKIYTVGPKSTLDNPIKIKDVTKACKQSFPTPDGKQQRIMSVIPDTIKGPLYVEIETSYDTLYGVGLGVDYIYSKGTPPRGKDSTLWIADSYDAEASINKNLVSSFDLKINNGVNGSVTAVKTTEINQGEKVTLNVKPENGYQLDKLTVAGVDVTNKVADGKYTFTMPASNVAVSATFKAKSYSVWTQTVEHGFITANPNSNLKAGDTVTITATPESGYTLEKITYYDNNGVKQTLTLDENNKFTMPAYSVALTAHFVDDRQSYEVKVTQPQTGGKISANSTSAKEGDTVSLSATPSDGYLLKEFEVKDANEKTVDVNENNQFTMPSSNVTVTAEFKAKPKDVYPISVEPSQNGSVGVVSSARNGDKVTVTVNPNEYYELASLTYNGTPITKDGQDNYKFTMPDKAVSIAATFKQKEITGQQEGEIAIPSDGDLIKITNKQTGLDLKIFKRDSNDRPLEGGKFTLKKTDEDYTREDSSFTKEGISGTDGKLVFTDNAGNEQSLALQPGYYVLEETESPSGYKKAQAPWKIHVYEDSTTNQLKAEYQGPDETPNSFVNSDKALDGYDPDNTQEQSPIKTTNSGIKYAARMTNINTEGKTYIQRIYIDTRAYNKPVNVQIKPVIKREELDTPGQPPKIGYNGKYGVKTAYRSTYEIKGLDGNPDKAKLNDIFRNYTIANDDVSVVNTARWRPFDWGFDEDQLNLDPGVYYIDVEGFYDDNITDFGKIEMKVDFMTPRYFWQADGFNQNGTQHYKLGGSYQAGAETFGSVYKEDTYVNGVIKKKGTPTLWGESQPAGQKYPNWLSKEFTDKYGKERKAGIVAVPSGWDESDIASVTTSISIKPLYTSSKTTQVPTEGMNIVNEEETYNITFSKHGRDDIDEKINGEEVTKRRLEGAVFKLQEFVINDYKDVEGSTISSAFNGYFGFRGLKPGRYRLMEVKAPEGYKPIDGPLLYFTVETIKTNSGKIVDPESGNVVDIKSINVKFSENDEKSYKLSDLSMVNPDNPNQIIKVSSVDSKKINIKKSQIVNPTTNAIVNLNDLIIVIEDGYKYPINQIKIVDGSSGYISLEYDKANGVYQYVPEKSTSEKDGKLVDFVTSATAKNMGKIVNEKPGKGEITVKKVDQKGDEIKATDQLPGATFKLTNKSTGAIETKTVGKDGTLKFTGLNIGDYRLEEIKSPDGYINNKQVWNFTVGGEGLDPYSGEAPAKRKDVSSSIKMTESKLSVLNPKSKNDGLLSDTKGEMHPHLGEVFEFDNKYSIDSNLKINPGDYFVLKLSDNIDLHGVMENHITNLDLIADGVGTIAKADYNRKEGTITYTFTDYAKTYNLVDFSNKLKAYINLNKVPKESSQSIERGVYGHDMIKKDINVIYDSMTAREKYQDNYGYWHEMTQDHLNLGSKIIKFNPDTGEFVHYYYVNRDRSNTPRSRFYYSSDQNIENLNIDSYFIVGSKENANTLMPDSFGVNEDSQNLPYPVRKISRSYLYSGQEVSIDFTNGLNSNSSYILKVTGKVSGKDKSSYVGHGKLQMMDYSGRYVTRWDGHYAYENEATAKANLEIQAVNPENKIKFKKVNLEGNALKGAIFQLFKKDNEDNWNTHGKPITTSKDGSIEYSGLAKGEYQLKETTAPDGYAKPDGPLAEFKVDENGKIFIKEVYKNEKGQEKERYVEEPGVVPIPIVNKKEEHEIEFKKVDEKDNRALEGAEFEVHYKVKETDKKYEPLKVKTTDKEGKKVEKTMTAKSDKDGKFTLPITKDGYYALVETKAPDGYMTPTEPVYEFRLENGKVQVLKNNVDKVTTNDGYLESQVLEVNKENKTFKQRIIINPKNSVIPINPDNSYLRIIEDGYNITLVKITSIGMNGHEETIAYSPKVVGGEERYYLKGLINKPDATSRINLSSKIVVEFTGTIDDANTKANITTDLIVDLTESGLKEENITFIIDTEKDKSQQSAYTDKYNTSILIKNKKPTYPSTGGRGAFIGFAIVGTAVMLAAIAYFGIFQNDKNRRRSARYKK